jgi:hypothetical protein
MRPPRDINDRPDVAHRGFKALRRFLARYRPRYQLHGHIHLYDRSEPHTADFAATKIINVYPYQVLDLEFPELPETGADPAGASVAPAPVPVATAAPADPATR